MPGQRKDIPLFDPKQDRSFFMDLTGRRCWLQNGIPYNIKTFEPEWSMLEDPSSPFYCGPKPDAKQEEFDTTKPDQSLDQDNEKTDNDSNIGSLSKNDNNLLDNFGAIPQNIVKVRKKRSRDLSHGKWKLYRKAGR